MGATSCAGVQVGEGKGLEAGSTRHFLPWDPGSTLRPPGPARSVCSPVKWVQNLEDGGCGWASLGWRPPVFHLRSGAAPPSPAPEPLPPSLAPEPAGVSGTRPAPPQAPRPVSRPSPSAAEGDRGCQATHRQGWADPVSVFPKPAPPTSQKRKLRHRVGRAKPPLVTPLSSQRGFLSSLSGSPLPYGLPCPHHPLGSSPQAFPRLSEGQPPMQPRELEADKARKAQGVAKARQPPPTLQVHGWANRKFSFVAKQHFCLGC